MTVFSSLYTSWLNEELASDDSTVLFTTARRKSAINRGVREFSELTECFTKQSTITLTGGTAEYDLNDIAITAPLGDFVRFTKEQVRFTYTDAAGQVTVLAGDDLPRRDVEWLNRFQPGWQVSTVASTTMQLPQVYYERIEGGYRYLGFWPTPSTGSSASMKVNVPYLAFPKVMSDDTDEPFMVNSTQLRWDLRPYHQGIVHFAAYQLEKLRGDTEKSEFQFKKFMGYVTRYLANARVKGGRIMTYTRNYFQPRGRDRGTDPRR